MDLQVPKSKITKIIQIKMQNHRRNKIPSYYAINQSCIMSLKTKYLPETPNHSREQQIGTRLKQLRIRRLTHYYENLSPSYFYISAKK